MYVLISFVAQGTICDFCLPIGTVLSLENQIRGSIARRAGGDTCEADYSLFAI